MKQYKSITKQLNETLRKGHVNYSFPSNNFPKEKKNPTKTFIGGLFIGLALAGAIYFVLSALLPSESCVAFRNDLQALNLYSQNETQ